MALLALLRAAYKVPLQSILVVPYTQRLESALSYLTVNSTILFQMVSKSSDSCFGEALYLALSNSVTKDNIFICNYACYILVEYHSGVGTGGGGGGGGGLGPGEPLAPLPPNTSEGGARPPQ